MLENKKNVRKIIVMIIALIVILGVFISVKILQKERTEIDKIAAKKINNFKSGLRIADLELGNGTIKPIYKPEWQKVSSSIDIDNKKLTVVVKGYAYKTQTINTDVSIDYGSDVQSTLAPEDIQLFIDGKEVTSPNDINIQVTSATTSTSGTSQKEEVTHTITISNLEEATRRAGIPYKDWSGNISLKIAGRGKDESTYNADVLTDDDENQNMMETDEDQAVGTWINVTFEDEKVAQNTNGKMYADFMKPEITYKYAGTSRDNPTPTNPEIKYDDKKVIVVFDVIDKYFKEAALDGDDITVSMSFYDDTLSKIYYDDTVLQSAIQKQLSVKTIPADVTEGNITYKANGDIYYDIDGDGVQQKIGQRYELQITKLEQAINNGFKFSGYMSLSIPEGQVDASTNALTVGIRDNSGNINSAKTITIGIDEDDGKDGQDETGDGVIVDVVDPVWEKVSASPTAGEIIIRAKDKYLNSVSLDSSNITVYINDIKDGDTNADGVVDVEPTITKNIDFVRYLKITEDEDGIETITEVADQSAANAVEYKVTLGNITLDTVEYDKFIPQNADELVLDEDGGARYRKENGGAVKIEVAAGIITDKSGNTNKTSDKFEIGDMDATKPRVYDIQKTKDEANDKLTFVFNVTDRNYNPDDIQNLIVKNELTLSVDGVTISNDKITSLTYKEIKHPKIDGVEGKVLGHQYTVVIEDFVETDSEFTASGRKYRDLSGTVQLKIAETAAKDKNGNKLEEDTTTLSEFIDYIKPEIQKVTVTNPIDTTNKTYTMSFKVLDKYIDTANLVAKEEITVYIDGQAASSITKELTSTPITESCKKTVNGVITEGTHTVGHEYTLVLKGFEQTELQTGKNFMEWSGTVSIEIAQNAVNDKDGVTNTAVHTLDSTVAKRTVTGEHVDFIKPVLEKVSSERGTNTEIIYFNIIDKYLDTADLVTDTEIKVYVDNEEVTGLTKNITRLTDNDVTATVNGESRTVSQQYKLELSGFEQASRNANNFKDWSGTVKIEILEEAVKDTSLNNLTPEVAKRTIDGDFVDFIKPELRYTHQSTDISTGTKIYTMTFDVTDKYYTSGELQLSDLTIQMQNGQKDANGDLIVYNLNTLNTEGKIDLELTATPYYTPQSVNVTNATTGAVETLTAGTHQIGHTYTLKVTNLEKLEIENGNTTANYSGVITVAVAGDAIADRTIEGNSNKNSATSLTVGVDETDGIPNETPPEGGVPVDVVDPLWTKVSSSALAKQPTDAVNESATTGTVTLTIKGTDTYLDTSDTDASTLTNDEIQIYVNGTLKYGDSDGDGTIDVTELAAPTISTVTKLEESRTVDETTSTVQYGVQYTITITGFVQNANQVKVRILKDAIKDKTVDNDGTAHINGNKQTDFIVYNVLRKTDTEYVQDNEDASKIKPFLGESVATTIYPEGVTSITAIQRQDIEKVIFIDSTSGSKATGVQRVWDVSAQGDKSILAWTSQTSAPYTVYIGSDFEIFANQDSTALFSYIGYGESCTATTIVESQKTTETPSTTTTDLSLLNTSSVLNMSNMFSGFGYREMTTLNLGSNFDISNVTNMKEMFHLCGYSKMTNMYFGTTTGIETGVITFPADFDTSKVTDMSGMFAGFGYTAMTKLNLGSNFYTNNVTDMSSMFMECGYTAMTSLNLGANFNTSNVNNMSKMFNGCGYTVMTNIYFGTTTEIETGIITLPDNFNTSKVTNMELMFNQFGNKKIISLNLGNNFDTSKVTNMQQMFNQCGSVKMTSLDLGEKFDTNNVTNMYAMFQSCQSLTTLDLGFAFTKIPNGKVTITNDNGTTSEEDAYESMFSNCGTSSTTIYAPEAIYKNKNAFKLNSTDTTATPDDLKYTAGTINPVYRPQWEKVSSEFDNATEPTKLKINIKGTASHTEELADGKVKINYDSKVTTNLTAEDIQVYINGELDGDLNKNGVLDDGETPGITKALTQPSPAIGIEEATHTLTLSGFEETSRQTGKPFKEWSGNISIRIGGRGEATSTYTANTLVEYQDRNADGIADTNVNQSMMQIDETGNWIDVIYKDADSTTNINTSGTMFIDTIKPEFTYRYSETIIGDGNNTDTNYKNTKKVIIVFDVLDKYFKQTQLSTDTLASLITVKVDNVEVNTTVKVTKSLTKLDDIKYTVNGVENTKVGEKYQLEITGLEQIDATTGLSNGYTYSGPMTIAFSNDIIEDCSGNKNSATAITIGVDETDGNPNITPPEGGVVVDVVDPAWELVEASVETGEIIIRAKDKYFASTTLVPSNITIWVNGVQDGDLDGDGVVESTPIITKTLSNPTYKKLDGNGDYVETDILEEAIAVEYKVTLGNITLDTGAYVEFTPTNASELVGDTAKYKAENGGKIELEIAKGVIKDDSGNENQKSKFLVGTMDSTRPEVYDIQKVKDAENDKLTMVFNVTDRNYDPENLITINEDKDNDGNIDPEITLWLDGTQISNEKITSLTYKEIKASIDGTTKVLGHQYTIVINDFVESDDVFVTLSREYRELSGTVEVRIAEDAANDLNENKLNTDTTTISEFIDYIKPEINYQYSASSQEIAGDIDYGVKTFEMQFDIIDKYFENSTLTIDNLTILIDGEEPNWRETGETVGVSKNLTSEEIKQTFNKTVNGEVKNGEYVIGKRYTLKLSNLEQLDKFAGKQYIDYSGVITVDIPVGELNENGTIKVGAIDSTGNLNKATKITSGIDIKGDVQLPEEDDPEVVDVVDPILEKVSTSANAINKEAKIEFKAIDKYFSESKITDATIKDYIKVFAHTGSTPGTEATDITENVTIVINSVEDVKDTFVKTVDGELKNQEYVIGKKYEITVSNFDQDVNQIKIQIQKNAILDTSLNGNKLTEIIAYNVLRLTDNEIVYEDDGSVKISDTIIKGFLGQTDIQRQYVEQVVFENSITGSTAEGVKKVWDVSAAGDGSIKAWTSQTSEPYTVYIGSNYEIFANQKATALFSSIGYATNCTKTETMKNLNLLNTNSVTNMEDMFFAFGYNMMQNLDLGNFDTQNVENMNRMFEMCGMKKMQSLDLGNAFNTTKVETMVAMFKQCGQNLMSTIDLGDKFNTSNVTNMKQMFYNCGKTLMTNMYFGTAEEISTGVITLPDNFNTSKVEQMDMMFEGFGAGQIKEFNLGNSFNTSSVTSMSNMFKECGSAVLKTLNLGANFDTKQVQNMSGMFEGFAKQSSTMTTLDLGDKFYTTEVADMTNMFKNCGTAAMTILDLGPAFTRIPDKLLDDSGNATEDSAHTDFVTSCGNSNTVIKAAESIFKDQNNFKLNTDSTTADINYTVGTIDATYKPEWTKVSSSLQINETNLSESTMTIVVKGNVDATVYGDALKTITSAVTAGNDANAQINVLVDGEVAEEITQTIEVVESTSTQVQYKITLSNFKELVRRTDKGKNFLEWSGNVALQFVRGSLVDAYGNKNLVELNGTVIQINDANGEDVNGNGTLDEGEDINANEQLDEYLDRNVESNMMFADYIKPEFTYEYADTVIGDGPSGDKKVKVVFDVSDKYFKETTLSTDTNASLITVKIDNEDINNSIQKTLTKTAIFVMDRDTKIVTSKAIDYQLGSTEQKVGERYELLIDKLQSQDGEGYSGPMTLAFPAGVITDLSENKSDAKTITIGIDDPTNHPEHNTAVIVDLVNPIWIGPHDVNTIDRTTDTVSVTILGKDKYYLSDVFATDLADGTVTPETLGKIKVYIDDELQSSISKSITAITDSEQLKALASNAGVTVATDVRVGYIIELTNFGTLPTSLSGITKIVIDSGTIEDESGNINNPSTIYVGNEDWVELNEPLVSGEDGYPRYRAFRSDVVDFIDPVITYEYSTVEGLENPDIDYEQKTVTVKFKVSDKYLIGSTIINADGKLNTDAVRILIHDHLTGTMVDRTASVTTSITADSEDLTDGEIVYTLKVSNIQQNPTDGFNFSGTMQLLFTEEIIDDKSGNKNAGTTITLDTEIGNDVVDVVDPVIYYRTSSIDRINDNVTLTVRADDKYISTEKLVELQDSVIVKVVKPNGYIVESTADSATLTKPDGTILSTTTISRSITKITQQSQYITFQIVLSGFGTHEGKTSVIIPENVVFDTSNNGNRETEIEVGSTADATAFGESIVDFTDPIWEYSVSSINRDTETDVNGNTVRKETGTVTIEVKATDIYLDNKYFNDADYQLNLSNVKVFIDEVQNTQITKTFATNDDGTIKKEYITETAENEDILKGVKYTIILGNFQANEGKVKILIPKETVKDTSMNANIDTTIEVGNPEWIETDVETNVANPKYTGFRNDIVDFIKPIITYQYQENINPLFTTVTGADGQENEAVQITFNVTDTNYLETDIGLEDIQIFVDVDSNERNVTNILTKSIDDEVIEKGMSYTLTLSGFEQERELTEVFKRHSGAIKLIIAADQVADSSGNKNVETTIIVDDDDGDDITNPVIVDFIKPIIYYDSQYINWNERYAEIKIKGTDRFFDTDSVLNPEDIKLYELNTEGQYIEVTDFNGKIQILKDEIKDGDGNLLGYDYTIKLNEFVEEYKMKVCIPAGYIDTDGTIVGLGDTSGNLNEETEIELVLDNKKPRWEYLSTDTTLFESDGKISFDVKGVDKFLNIAQSGLDLDNPELKVFRDGVDITSSVGITVTEDTENSSSTEKSKAYKIDVTGLTAIGTYSLVFEEKTLIDEFDNESAAKTITFSKSTIASNTGNYIMVTYHVSPDNEQTHNSFVHELMSVNESGTNFENTTYRPSTLGELYNDGQNPLFAEPAGQSFAGWAEADENGNPILDGTEYKKVYGLYEEIPNTVTHLKAIWQNATVIYVATTGSNSNDGTTTGTPVRDIQTANSLLTVSGTTENNIIVIMDEIKWSSSTILSKNATITSLYAGIDYRAQGAELMIDSDIATNADITFDNIELYTESTTTRLIANYNDVTLGRRITTQSDKYTIGTVIGGNYDTESSTGTLGEHTIRVEAGKYNNIIAGSTLTTATTASKSVLHEVIIGNMREAAISRNDKLTITGYLAIGENELRCYPNGSQTSATAVNKEYANVTLYSGTFTGDNAAIEDAVIYLRSINGETDGQMKFEMYGGAVNGNIYGGTATTTTTGTVFNTMNFYGGQIEGDVFGQGANEVFTGGSLITLQGNINIEGNLFGGSNVTSEFAEKRIGQGKSIITVNTNSSTVSGNIYGGSKNTTETIDYYVEGDTNIILNSGSALNIYGGGFGSDIFGTTNITIENGTVTQNIFGGSYHGQARMTSNITVLGGRVNGDIYGGNENTETLLTNDTKAQDINIIIGDTDTTKEPTINGVIYGSGKYDKVDEVKIQLIESENTTTVYGGSNTNSETATTNIYLKGMTVNEIYGGGQSAGTVTISNIYLETGTVTDVYGGGYAANVAESNITVEGTSTVTSIYGGVNGSASQTGSVTTSNITLKSATRVTNVFGGGNLTAVETANVTLDGMIIDTIHGGSKNAGVTTKTNIKLVSGRVTNVFGGGLDVGVGTSNVTHSENATVVNIYGGNNSLTGVGGDTTTTNINIGSQDKSIEVTNVYGGNYQYGTTQYTNITIQGDTTIHGKLFGGGYQSAIGTEADAGSTTINISGGTIDKDIYGGSEESIVYGTTNINIGVEAATQATSNYTLKENNILIKGTIYGAGTLTSTDYSETSVQGNTNILLDNSTDSPITINGSVIGAGKGAIYSPNGTSTDTSTIHLKDFGTSDNIYKLLSIERTGDVYIGNSFIELSGNRDINGSYYTMNRITNALTVYNNTTLYTRKGFNMVGGFNSYVTKTGTKATAEISGATVTTNVDNRLYTLEGVNLIFAKVEVNRINRASISQSQWGEINGMTFFGMYANRSDGTKYYDIYAPNYTGNAVEGFFASGTYVEGQHEYNHTLTTDGFYTNEADYTDPDNITVTPKILQTVGEDVIDGVNYYDWIIGADVVNYRVSLIASTYSKESIAELLLDYAYAQGTSYEISKVSTNALNTDINLVDSSNIPVISESNANNTFALTMETDRTGWLSTGLTNIYTADGGSYGGDTSYGSDSTTEPGKLIFRLFNSVNITEQKDLGNVNIILRGQRPTSEDGNEAGQFKIVIAVELQSIVEERELHYVPRFTNSIATELDYTSDSKVDLSYLLYKEGLEDTLYESGDYRILSTSIKLPTGTKLTMRDYVQDKLYYYHITDDTTYTTETTSGVIRYIYKLSNFIEMGATTTKYVDDNSKYYNSSGYVLEKYDISIDFVDSGITTNTLAQETYIELRKSGGTLKYDNGNTDIKYNLYYDQSAKATVELEGVLESYTITDDITIPFTLEASMLEQGSVIDTKFDDEITGIAIKIVDTNGTVTVLPELQNFKLVNVKDGTEYYSDLTGVIRLPIMESFATFISDYQLVFTQANVEPGKHYVEVHLYTADDGLFYGEESEAYTRFEVIFVSKASGGLAGLVADSDTRIINSQTGKNLKVEDNKGIDITMSLVNAIEDTNIRVELYKRNPTYTVTENADGSKSYTYTGTSYQSVDLKDYIKGEWITPESKGLTTPTGSIQYIFYLDTETEAVAEEEEETTAVETILPFKKEIVEGIDSGEYKLVFTAYHKDKLIQTVRKTFIVTQ